LNCGHDILVTRKRKEEEFTESHKWKNFQSHSASRASFGSAAIRR
jgi:hypothetical protein